MSFVATNNTHLFLGIDNRSGYIRTAASRSKLGMIQCTSSQLNCPVIRCFRASQSALKPLKQWESGTFWWYFSARSLGQRWHRCIGDANLAEDDSTCSSRHQP